MSRKEINSLCAFHVELSLARCIGRVKRDQLDTHQVVARRNARWHREVVPPLVGDHGVDGPLAVVQTLLGYLEPFQACGPGGRCVVHLGEVNGDGAFILISMDLV